MDARAKHEFCGLSRYIAEVLLIVQVVGFVVILSGSSLYNELIRVCMPNTAVSDETEVEVILNSLCSGISLSIPLLRYNASTGYTQLIKCAVKMQVSMNCEHFLHRTT